MFNLLISNNNWSRDIRTIILTKFCLNWVMSCCVLLPPQKLLTLKYFLLLIAHCPQKEYKEAEVRGYSVGLSQGHINQGGEVMMANGTFRSSQCGGMKRTVKNAD